MITNSSSFEALIINIEISTAFDLPFGRLGQLLLSTCESVISKKISQGGKDSPPGIILKMLQNIPCYWATCTCPHLKDLTRLCMCTR
jgi:hypothetical protein